MLNFDVHQTMPTLLLVDDDLISREVIATILLMNGYNIFSADSGEAAVAQLQTGQYAPDAILVDAQMPGLSGIALITTLRTTCPAAIYLISASLPPTEAVAAADGFLLKPFDAAAVRTLLRGAPPVVSGKTLQKLRTMMTPAAVREIYGTVVGDLHQRIHALEAAIAHEDEDEMRHIGHAIKGGCGMAGALEAARIGARLEELPDVIAGDQLDNELSLLRDLRGAAQRLERMLEKEITL